MIDQRVVHELKTWPEPYDAIVRGFKHHEIRKNDRGFKVGDLLHLREFKDGSYTGCALYVVVTYLSEGGTWGLPADLCVMSIEIDMYRSVAGA